VYPDCTIHTVVEGSKDEGAQLTAVARIREIRVCVIFIVVRAALSHISAILTGCLWGSG